MTRINRFAVLQSGARTHVPAVLLLVMLAACTQPVSWQKLLAAKITQQYPTYQVRQTADGGLLVERPALPPLPVDVNAIAQFCQRGPKDCNYATDRMLLDLRQP